MKVIKSEDNLVEFDNGLKVTGIGDEDCCAVNYLDFEQLPVGTELPTLSLGGLVDYITVKEDGFSLKDINEIPKWVQARSQQNGYYSNITTLILEHEGKRIDLGKLEGEESDGDYE